MSEETKAIIDRLKAEGDLIRNTGTNSIKATNIALAKFENVFSVISANIAEQTDMMRTQLGIAADAQEIARTQAQFDEIKAAEPPKDPAESETKPLSEVGEERGNKIASALSMKNLLIGAGGLFVGYNLIKGAVDEATDGGFTAMEQSFKNIDWAGFGTAMNSVIQSILNFEEWMDGLPALLIGGGLMGVGLRSAARGVADSLLGPGGRRNPRGGARLRGLRAIRGGLAGAVTGLAIAYGDDVKAWLENEMKVDADVANITVDAVTYGLGAVSLAAMFGVGLVPGLLIGAAVGAAYLIGKTAYDWMKNRQNAAAEDLKRRLAAMEAMGYDGELEGAGSGKTLSPNAPVSATAGMVSLKAEEMGLVTPAQLAAAANGDTQAAAEVQAAYQQAAEEITEEVRDLAIHAINSQMNVLAEGDYEAGINDDVMNVITSNMETLYAPDNPVLMSAYEGLVRHFNEYVLQGMTPSDEDWQYLSEDYRQLYNDLNEGLVGRSSSQIVQDAADRAFKVLHADDLDPRKGIYAPSKNFIPKTPMENGRLIIYDEFGNPHLLSSAEQNGPLGALLRDGVVSGSPSITIMGGDTVVAPQTSIREGSPSLVTNQYNGGGGGGGGSGVAAYGLTSGLVGGGGR